MSVMWVIILHLCMKFEVRRPSSAKYICSHHRVRHGIDRQTDNSHQCIMPHIRRAGA